MSWEEHAAAPAAFPGEGPRPSTWPGQACGLEVRPVDPQCSLLARPGIRRAMCPPGRSLRGRGHSRGCRSVSAGMRGFPALTRSCGSTPGSPIWLCHPSGVLRFCRLPPTFPKESTPLCGLPPPLTAWKTGAAQHQLPGIDPEATHYHSSRLRLRSSTTRVQFLALHFSLSNTGQVP